MLLLCLFSTNIQAKQNLPTSFVQIINSLKQNQHNRDNVVYFSNSAKHELWQSIGLLTMFVDDNAKMATVCTATLIERRILITAAHCIHNGQKFITKGYFKPHNSDNKYAIVGIMPLSMEGLVKGDIDYDTAFILLEEGSWHITPTIKLGSINHRHDNLFLLALGYQGDLSSYRNTLAKNSIQIAATNKYRTIAKYQNQFEHKAITEKGTSGGPVLAYDEKTSQLALVGIISAVRSRTITIQQQEFREDWGVAMRINQPVLQTLNKIIRAKNLQQNSGLR
jgi:V8-like Glu-specific endopeptidase